MARRASATARLLALRRELGEAADHGALSIRQRIDHGEMIRPGDGLVAGLRADSWGKAGAQTRYQAIAGTNHFTVIDALADRQSAMVGRLTELAPQRK